jgi:mycofactocin glycosyltransferase
MHAAPPQISIIVPCLRHADELKNCLQGLERQEGDVLFEVIVVDSAADPNVEAAVRGLPGVRLLRSDRSLSAGAARNFGANAASADILGFMDADCVPDPGWVRAAVQAIEEGAAIASGPILDAMPWHLIASTDNRLQFADFPARRPAGMSSYFPGAHLAMSNRIFASIGGFSEAARVAQDVLFTDEAARRWPGGLRFCPRLIVRHHGRARWADFLSHQRAFGHGRAQFGLHMSPSLLWLGQHRSLSGVVLLRRLLYISGRVAQWNLPDLPRFLTQLPLVLIGLAAWTRGFYEGMQMRNYDQA